MSRQLSDVALPRAHDPVRITASLPVSSKNTATTACAARSCAGVGYVARNDTPVIAAPLFSPCLALSPHASVSSAASAAPPAFAAARGRTALAGELASFPRMV